jgi:hypothetical protein
MCSLWFKHLNIFTPDGQRDSAARFFNPEIRSRQSKVWEDNFSLALTNLLSSQFTAANIVWQKPNYCHDLITGEWITTSTAQTPNIRELRFLIGSLSGILLS